MGCNGTCILMSQFGAGGYIRTCLSHYVSAYVNIGDRKTILINLPTQEVPIIIVTEKPLLLWKLRKAKSCSRILVNQLFLSTKLTFVYRLVLFADEVNICIVYPS